MRHVTRIARRTVETRRRCSAILPAGRGVDFDALGQFAARIQEERLLRQFRLTVPRAETLEGRFARIERARRRLRILLTEIPATALSALGFFDFGRHGQETGIAQRKTLPTTDGQRLAVRTAALQHARRRPSGASGRRTRCGLVLGFTPAVADGAFTAVTGFAQTQVDNARDRIRTVLRRSAVAQHFNGADRVVGDGVEVSG